MRIHLLDRMNPLVKVVTILVVCIMMALTSTWQINLFIVALCTLCLIFLSDCSMLAWIKTMIPVCLLAFAIFTSALAGGIPEADSSSIYQVTSLGSALLLSTRILAYVSLGLSFALSTDPTEFAMSLIHQAHVPPKFAYGVLAAYNLIPTLRREWDEVNLAYRARGKSTGILPLGPLFNTLVNGIRWSENVAMAMESKGFDTEADRTYALTTNVHVKDYIIAVISIALMAVAMLLLT